MQDSNIQDLELIARNPESGELTRDTCRRLAAAWQCVRCADERRVMH